MNNLEKLPPKLDVKEYTRKQIERAEAVVQGRQLKIIDPSSSNQKIPMLEKIVSIFTKKKNNHFSKMNDDVIHHIFTFLSPQSLCRVAQISKRFNKISKSPLLWKNFLEIEHPDLYKKLLKVNRHVNWEQLSKFSLKISHLKNNYEDHTRILKEIEQKQLKLKKIIKIEGIALSMIALIMLQSKFDLLELSESGAETVDLDFFIADI
jgi:hypothetical protein